jgi:hypothetical protein
LLLKHEEVIQQTNSADRLQLRLIFIVRRKCIGAELNSNADGFSMAAIDRTNLGRIFAEAFQRYGPQTPNIDPSAGVTPYYPQNPFPDIYCGFVDTDELNAMALIYKGHELVALFHGLINFINPYYAAFLSDPRMFQEIGDPSKDRKTDELNAMRIEYLKKYPTWGGAPLSLCPIRSRTAVRAMSCGLLFLHAHEVAHIVLGHLDLLTDEFGMSVYEELPIVPLSAKESDLRKALELQADQSAALMSLHLFREQLQKPSDEEEFKNADLLWSIAVESLFVLLQLVIARKGIRPSLTHPSPFARWLNVKLCVDDEAEEHGIRRLQLPETGPSTMKQVIDWLTTNSLTEGRPLFPHNGAETAIEELFSTWEAVRPYKANLEHYRAIRGNRAVHRVPQ